jgi:hypothetical protein
MPVNIEELLPTAQEMQRQATINDAEKAERYAQNLVAAEAEKRALVENLGKSADLSADEKVALAATIIRRAVQNGLSEVQIYRFPASLCKDHGSAIKQRKAGWERTLTGVPLEIYRLWSDYLDTRGYRILYQFTDFPGAVTGDVSVILSWSN